MLSVKQYYIHYLLIELGYLNRVQKWGILALLNLFLFTFLGPIIIT
jgi:hypothetical protein